MAHPQAPGEERLDGAGWRAFPKEKGGSLRRVMLRHAGVSRMPRLRARDDDRALAAHHVLAGELDDELAQGPALVLLVRLRHAPAQARPSLAQRVPGIAQ